ncbi:hypothetical protein AMJ85_08435 [candidate division BRC1 bacterium SM23_51]|nr:MAG: hypothetical protein AMJ85_08435 [candidate division BRC1 bacterium SM23_51]
MTGKRDIVQHYFSAPMFLAYGWACAFTAFSAAVGLSATRLWPAWLTWPAVLLGFGALFALVIGLRPILLDLTSDLGIREKLGVFLLHVLIFFGPKLASPRASLIDCLIALQVPLVVLLIRRENFMRLYGVNFLLVALAAFVSWQTERGGFEWAACLPVFLACCFAGDYFFLELDRYPDVTARPAGRSFLLGIEYGAISLVGGLVLYAVTPAMATADRAAVARPVVQRPGGVQTVSLDALIRLVWDTFLLLILIVVALAILQWLKRKFRRGEAGQESEMGGGVMRMVRRAVRPRPRPPQMPRGFSPREQILRGYWAWCDELERFGLGRAPVATPKEFARTVVRFERAAARSVGDLTRLFEWAKYDRRDLTRGDAEAFFAHSRRVIEIMLASAQST